MTKKNDGTPPTSTQDELFDDEHYDEDFSASALEFGGGYYGGKDEDNEDKQSLNKIGSSSGMSLGGSDDHFDGHKEDDDDDSIKDNASKRVRCSKMMVYMALFLAAAAVSTVSYIFLEREEESNMEVEFSAYSREILKQAQANSRYMFEELMDLSKAITSHALDANMTWPNVTIPHFDIRAHDLKRSSGNLEFVGFAPFVTPNQTAGWEQYTKENQGWLEQDYHYRNWTEKPPPIPPKIHFYNDSGLTTANYISFEDPMFDYEIPLWQIAPAPKDTNAINLDLATIPVFAHLLWDIKVKKVKQYSRIMDLIFLLGDDIFYPDHPRGTIYQPVFEDFYENAEVGGFVLGTLTWDQMFENVLFESSAPLLVEIEGTCNAIFTYKLNGGDTNIEFLGYGSGFRDPKYDKYKRSADLLHPLNSRPGYPAVKHSHRATDASHGDSHCTYVMNTYPTAAFESYYRTSEPIYMAIVVASIFAFTALIFFLYDYLVQERQSKLATTAKRTEAIVTSLFPKNVGKRLLEEANEEQKAKNEHTKNNKRGLQFKSMTEMMSKEFMDDAPPGPIRPGKPIADIFPSATIMFGDLVGFTAWSSTREPSHVFVLLETLYGAFDTIAKKRRVFKIETVGDCYVAVCGLPEERPDHAVCMARFARDCIQALGEQAVALETHLGPETSELAMRIGLHSGAVTAGVLRGDRARFQLFGDSVNTCARIETTGKPNQIHLSESCAKLLIKSGKQRWVVQRQDMVEAKGKGLLQTYWLTDGGGGSDGLSKTSSDLSGSVSSFEYLNYAEQSRLEWAEKGREQTEMYLQTYNDNAPTTSRKGSCSTTAQNLLASSDDVSVASSTTVELMHESGRTPADFRLYLKHGVRHCEV